MIFRSGYRSRNVSVILNVEKNNVSSIFLQVTTRATGIRRMIFQHRSGCRIRDVSQ